MTSLYGSYKTEISDPLTGWKSEDPEGNDLKKARKPRT